MNISLRGTPALRTFARTVVFSLVAAVVTVPAIAASSAANQPKAKVHKTTSWTPAVATKGGSKTSVLGKAAKSGNKLSGSTVLTTTDAYITMLPGAPVGGFQFTETNTGGVGNSQADGGTSYYGSAYLSLSSDQGSHVGGGPTHQSYSGQDDMLVIRDTTPWSETFTCMRYGDMFTSSNDAGTAPAVSKSPIEYLSARAGHNYQYFGWAWYANHQYTGAPYTCDISEVPDGTNSNILRHDGPGDFYMAQAGVSGAIYFYGLNATNPGWLHNLTTDNWSLGRLADSGSAGTKFAWGNPSSESLTVITIGHQNDYTSSSGLWFGRAPSYDGGPSIPDAPTMVACMPASELSSHTFKVDGHNLYMDSSATDFWATNSTLFEVVVLEPAYRTGISCATQYGDGFHTVADDGANSHPPTEWLTYQLPVIDVTRTTVNPGETVTYTSVNPDYSNLFTNSNMFSAFLKDHNAPDIADSWYPYDGGSYANNSYPNNLDYWSNYVSCQDPNGVDLRIKMYYGSNQDVLDDPMDFTYVDSKFITFTPQLTAICQNATPIAPDFNADPAVNAESITTTSANNYLVILPNGQDTLRFNPQFNNGVITEAWYNDYQTIETATVDGVPMSYDEMPVDINLSTAENGVQVVDYYVVSPDGLHSTHVTYTFAHTPPIPGPAVTGVSPASGPATGGTSVTIGGGTFLETPTVNVGGVACVVTAFTATTVTCTTGAHAPGNVSVSVSNPGTLTTTLPNAYTYISAPTIGSIEPNHGPMVGGTGISITGSGFISMPTILVDGIPCTDVYFGGAGYLECVTGAGPAGLGNVTITNPDSGTVTAVNAYTYDAPVIGSIDPDHGPTAGGTTITINGSGFVNGMTITVAGIPCTSVNVISATEVTCVTPEHSSGPADVVVTVPGLGAATASGGFTYDGPTAPNIVYNKDILNAGITLPSGVTVNPAANPAQGVGVVGVNDVVVHVPFGTDITSLPFNFTITAPDVMLVGSTVQVSGVTKNNFTTPVTYTVTAPDGTTKNYTVTVVVDPAPAGTPTTPTTTPTTPAPATDALSVGAITPKAGPVTGGTTVTITGTGFTSGTSVTLGGAACSPVTVVSSTQITCITPAHVAGVVDVVVSDAGKSATAAGAYTYADGTVQLGPLPANAGLAPGTTYVTVDGTPYQINVAPNGDANAIQLTATDWNLKLQAKGENGQPLALDDQNRIIVNPGLAAAFTGTGFMPNSDVYVYAFSTPKFMGIIRTDANGNFTSSLNVPDLATGGHTIQLNGLSPKGEVRSASVGVVVQPKVTIASGKVYFDYASSALDAKAKATIAAIVKKAKAAKGNIFITIVGWAQPTANSKHHVVLSNARAAAVAKALKAAGVKGTYTVSGKGLATSNVPASRYAEITVQVARK